MRLPGVYRGVVTDSQDPQAGGRVRVQVPAVGATTEWAPVCRAAGSVGGSLGVGQTVIVAFEGGDPGRPVVLGWIG